MMNWYNNNLRDTFVDFNRDLTGEASVTPDTNDYSFIYILYDKREDQGGKIIGYVDTRQEADSWVSHSKIERAWHQKLKCYLPGEKCSPLCGEVKIKAIDESTTRDTDKTQSI